MLLTKLFTRRHICSLLLALLASGCAGLPSAPPHTPIPDSGWMLFDVSRLRDYYYAPAHIERLSETTLKIRIATVAKGDKGRDWEVDERMKRGLSFGGYENYQSSEDVYLLNCSRKEYQLLSATDYDREGRLLNSKEYPDPSWKPIPRRSALDTLVSYKSICP